MKIHEYVGGLLHAKTMAIDGEIAMIGSANMDRRSFDLNYENNILVADAAFTAAVRERQDHYLASSTAIERATVDAWPVSRWFWNNAIGMLGPVL